MRIAVFLIICLFLTNCGKMKPRYNAADRPAARGTPELREQIKREYSRKYGRNPSEWRIDTEVQFRKQGTKTI